MPCRNHSHRETRKSVWMCAESTATVIVRGGHRGTVRHAPAHTAQSTYSAVQIHSCRALCNYLYVFLCVCWRNGKKRKEHSEAHQDGKRHSWMAAVHAVRPKPQQPCTVAAHTYPQKTKQNRRKTRRQGVAVCVWRCGCLPALAARKQNKRERNVCSAPQALVARPHVTAPSARRSSRPLLMRAAGEAHRAVVMSVSVGVRVERLGGKHTAPLTGRVQKKQLKEGRVEKKKTSILIAPQSKKKGMRD
ncbi:hypothetical protein ECC02_008260 [Trypanosoma cruzi]|uniref:Uncharacterized protein n=1 Tax=Trypanosoma cruzi TaxID=5693 RepID=A0A7J6XWE0_TRYCR|nr:hypothetical protein ECC02_008260 [Trypanosoma cruzi]